MKLCLFAAIRVISGLVSSCFSGSCASSAARARSPRPSCTCRRGGPPSLICGSSMGRARRLSRTQTCCSTARRSPRSGRPCAVPDRLSGDRWKRRNRDAGHRRHAQPHVLYRPAEPRRAGNSDGAVVVPQMTFSAPRLYLANGVTTMRTTGSVEPYADLNVKREIDTGQMIGPHMDVTGPYLEGPGSYFIQMHQLTDAEDARQTVAFWADEGATSFKAYMNITRAELKAAIDEAHRRHLKITGHCAR